ncbi:hypothetical protein LCGC14_1536120, partial [marine sediment metagenome]
EVIGERDRKELIQKIAVALEKALKQARAEVLAACIKKIDPDWLIEILRAYNDFAELDSSGTYPRNVVDEEIENLETLHQLQPSTSSLEALLREAELKGLKSDCIGIDDRLDSHNHNRDCVHCQRIAELEKARASEKRSKGEQTTGS